MKVAAECCWKRQSAFPPLWYIFCTIEVGHQTNHVGTVKKISIYLKNRNCFSFCYAFGMLWSPMRAMPQQIVHNIYKSMTGNNSNLKNSFARISS